MEVEILEFLKECRIINRQLHLIRLNKDDFSNESKEAILKILDTIDESLQKTRKELK